MGVSSVRVLVLCAIETGWDSVVKVIQDGANVVGVVGLRSGSYTKDQVAGLFDVRGAAESFGVSFLGVNDYSLRSESDKDLILSIGYDVIWVAGWQRLVPEWLIDSAPLGVLGVHGSPDGIMGGRGRSPQNWALILGCSRFDIALFHIRKGVDDGPVILERSFFYNEYDDIRVSYYKVSLLVSEMILEVLHSPEKIMTAVPQSLGAFYFPQRLPQDGLVDWLQAAAVISRHCRALTRPYPGLRAISCGVEVRIWQCQPFDDRVDGAVGEISHVFFDNTFLVNCADGRVLIREWSADQHDWNPVRKVVFDNAPLLDQLRLVVERHVNKFPEQKVSSRIVRLISNFLG